VEADAKWEDEISNQVLWVAYAPNGFFQIGMAGKNGFFFEVINYPFSNEKKRVLRWLD